MKQMFFLLFLIVFMYSCEDELNSPDDTFNDLSEGCTDEIAQNYDMEVYINDGSCIYVESEYLEYQGCENNNWIHHTCTSSEDGSNALDWDGSPSTCSALGYIYTSGSCNVSSDGGSNE